MESFNLIINFELIQSSIWKSIENYTLIDSCLLEFLFLNILQYYICFERILFKYKYGFFRPLQDLYMTESK